MSDEITRYWMGKQKLAIPDDFHEEIEPGDMDKLNNATIYLVSAPIFASIFVWGYSRLREEGGVASHFAHAISQAKNKFGSGGSRATASTKWPSKTGKKAPLVDEIG